MKILVTGGTGFIGSHTAVELQEQGFDVVIVDNLSNSTIEVLDNITKITGKRPVFEQFDLCDQSLTADFFGATTTLQVSFILQPIRLLENPSKNH